MNGDQARFREVLEKECDHMILPCYATYQLRYARGKASVDLCVFWCVLSCCTSADSQPHNTHRFVFYTMSGHEIIHMSHMCYMYYMSLSIQTPLLISEFSCFKVHPLLTQAFNCTHTACIISIGKNISVEQPHVRLRYLTQVIRID